MPQCYYDGCDNPPYGDCYVCGRNACRSHGVVKGDYFFCLSHRDSNVYGFFDKLFRKKAVVGKAKRSNAERMVETRAGGSGGRRLASDLRALYNDLQALPRPCLQSRHTQAFADGGYV